jgi:uncharacterized protein (TIGR02147 family)
MQTMSGDARPTVLEHADLKSYFQALNASIRARRGNYSQAAFARSLGCSPSFWNNYLEGRRDLSEEKLIQIGEKLGWETAEFAHATQLRAIQKGSHSAKSVEVKAVVQSRARVSRRIAKPAEEWTPGLGVVTAVLLECIRIPEYAKDPTRIAAKIGFSARLIDEVLRDLVAKGVLGNDSEKGYVRLGPPAVIIAPGDNRMLRNFYRSMFDIASRKMTPELADRRYLGSETMAFDPSLLPEAKRIINQCLDELAMLSYRCQNPTTVFYAGVQLFELFEKNFVEKKA